MIDAVCFRARIGIFNVRIRARACLKRNLNIKYKRGPSLCSFLLLYIGILLFGVLSSDLSIGYGFSLHGFSLHGFSLHSFSFHGFSFYGFSLRGIHYKISCYLRTTLQDSLLPVDYINSIYELLRRMA